MDVRLLFLTENWWNSMQVSDEIISFGFLLSVLFIGILTIF